MPQFSHDRLGELFLAASDLPKDERSAYVDEKCAGDAELKSTLLAMLDTVGDDSASLSRAAVDVDLSSLEDEDPVPSAIGPYQVVRRLDAGGMGVVYEARQTSPERSVALKVLRWVEDRSQTARFELEAEVLGWLRHPAIAHVYGTGTSQMPAGQRPWIAMEYVEGEAIDRYVQRMGLSTDGVLRLVARVLDGVAHAHSKGVVHRDLKPANIIIDVSGQPKIIDFGVAQTRRNTDFSTHTRAGDIIGTVAYMAPEQVRGDPAAIGTATDVYGMGALAYELIAVKRAVVPSGTELTEAMRRVLEVDPVRLESVSSASVDAATIVHTALAKDPARRYATAEAFAEDIRRYLAHEPIAARPPSALYQLRKLGRRHMGATIGLGLAALFLVVGTVTSTALYLSQRKISAARNVALGEARAATTASQEAAKEAQAATKEAERQLDVSTRVAGFYGSLLGRARPGADGREVKLVDVLESARERVPQEFSDAPDQYARLLVSFFEAHMGSGRFDDALEVIQEAVGVAESNPREKRRFLGAVHFKHSAALSMKQRFEEAEEALTRSIAAVETPTTFVECTVLLNGLQARANARLAMGDLAGAKEDLRFGLRFAEEMTVPAPGKASRIMQTLSQVALQEGKIDESIDWGSKAIESMRQEGQGESASFSLAQVVLGLAQIQHGQTAEGRGNLLESVEYQRRVNGPCMLMGRALQGVAQSYALEDDHEEAARRIEQARSSLGLAGQTPSPTLASVLCDQAAYLNKIGKREEAKATFREVPSVLGDCPSFTCLEMSGNALNGLAGLLSFDEQWEDARKVALESMELIERMPPNSRTDALRKRYAERLATIEEALDQK